MNLAKKRQNILLFIVIFILLIIYYWPTSYEAIKIDQPPELQKIERKNIFINLGTGNGDSVKYFFTNYAKPSEYASYKGYGTRSEKTWIVYAVEANPYFNSMLDDIKDLCENLGHIIYMYKETAAWIKNEKVEFYLDTVNRENNYWGSSLLKNHPDVISSNLTNIMINGIDISDILAQYTPEDEIILKIDIEGGEYKLLSHLIEKSTLKLVDVILVGFHDYLLTESSDKNSIYFKDYFEKLKITFVPFN